MSAKVVPAFPVSLVVPVRNETGSLRNLIESIQSQSRLPEEVILVDGGSVDGTPDLARALTGADGRYRVIEAGPATPGRGRNFGIAAAKHDWIALCDAGMVLEPDWLERLVEGGRGGADAAIVYGNCEPRRYVVRAQCCPGLRGPETGKTRRADARSVVPSSLLRRETWEKVGRFPDLRAAEDLIFMARVEAAGLQLAWAPHATVWWQLQPNLSGTFRRFADYSFHTARAGRAWHWQHAIARQYLVALLVVILAVVHSAWWAAVLVLALLVRTGLSIFRRREPALARPWILPGELVTVAGILLTIDLAMFFGWARACLAPRDTTAPQANS